MGMSDWKYYNYIGTSKHPLYKNATYDSVSQ